MSPGTVEERVQHWLQNTPSGERTQKHKARQKERICLVLLSRSAKVHHQHYQQDSSSHIECYETITC